VIIWLNRSQLAPDYPLFGVEVAKLGSYLHITKWGKQGGSGNLFREPKWGWGLKKKLFGARISWILGLDNTSRASQYSLTTIRCSRLCLFSRTKGTGKHFPRKQRKNIVYNTVIHWLMIYHHPMIHTCIVNNFLKNAYFIKKQFFLNTCTYLPSTVKIWQGLVNFQVQCVSFKTGCFPELAENVSHHLMIHLHMFWKFLNGNLFKPSENWTV